jgi:hypothetical protein
MQRADIQTFLETVQFTLTTYSCVPISDSCVCVTRTSSYAASGSRQLETWRDCEPETFALSRIVPLDRESRFTRTMLQDGLDAAGERMACGSVK